MIIVPININCGELAGINFSHHLKRSVFSPFGGICFKFSLGISGRAPILSIMMASKVVLN